MAESVGIAVENLLTEDGLVGFFQGFRPDGNALAGIFTGLEGGGELERRLHRLFVVAGDDRRPSSGRDAYFIVRKPEAIAPEQVQIAGDGWIDQLRSMATALGHAQAAEKLSQIQRVRVLEGIPPKHPREQWERCDLLGLLSETIPSWMAEVASEDVFAAAMRPAFYYINCDAMLRDYLMWPLYREHLTISDPLAPYFVLWSHGVKWRVFQDTQVDLYIPRQ